MMALGEQFFKLTIPKEGWVLIGYDAYFDETGDDGQFPIIGVAGYLIESSKVQSFELAWAKAKRHLPYIHMKSFAPGKGIYEHLTVDERKEINVDLVNAVNTHVDCGVAAFAPLGRFNRHQEDEPYSFCLTIAADLTEHLLGTKHVGQCEISFYYEMGRKHAYKAMEFMQKDSNNLFKSFASVKKEDSGLIQAADMLTWHLAKYVKDVVSGRRPPRKDFVALMDSVPGMYVQIFPFKKRNSSFPVL